MSKLICANGHQYDSEYGVCPYCNRSSNFREFKTQPPRDMSAEFGSVQNHQDVASGPKYQPPRRTQAPKGWNDVESMDQDKTTDPGKTIAKFGDIAGFMPVVGWLVCVDGEKRGKSFDLLAKMNTIGRGADMDVCVEWDNEVTRDTHATLDYDVKNNAFFLIPSKSTYINDVKVYTPTELNPYDIIEIGKTKLAFVSFCNEHFRWPQE